MRKFIPLVTFGALFLAAFPAEQGLAAQKTSLSVPTADLDLATPAGVAALDRRIAASIRSLCGATSDVDPRGKNEARRCRNAAQRSIAAARGTSIAAARRQSKAGIDDLAFGSPASVGK